MSLGHNTLTLEVTSYFSKYACATTLLNMGKCITGMLSNWYRANSRLAPSQWETSLQSNTVYHWIGTNYNQPCDNVTAAVQQNKAQQNQGSTYPTARRPGASKTVRRASRFGQIFLLNHISSGIEKSKFLKSGKWIFWEMASPENWRIFYGIYSMYLTGE